MDLTRGANVTDLRRFFAVNAYPSEHSDIVALMVLTHQAQLHNLITKASYETRKALHFEALLNRELGRKLNGHSDSTLSRIRSVAEPLVRGLLFVKETPLEGPVRGTSGFAEQFASMGPEDGQGRSLRDFDLNRRLFKYPCSYLIYSESFDALPAEAKEYVYRRLRQVLSGEETALEFAHVTPADRSAIREILTATKPEFAAMMAPPN
jgi:hypothetical protein